MEKSEKRGRWFVYVNERRERERKENSFKIWWTGNWHFVFIFWICEIFGSFYNRILCVFSFSLFLCSFLWRDHYQFSTTHILFLFSFSIWLTVDDLRGYTLMDMRMKGCHHINQIHAKYEEREKVGKTERECGLGGRRFPYWLMNNG